MENLKKNLKITAILSLFLINVQCDIWKSRRGNVIALPPTSASALSIEACQFYKIETAIINCFEQRNYFKQTLSERKNIIGSVCFKQAFSGVWGANFNPSPYVYNPESVKNTNFHWHFHLGNIQKGSPSAFPPNSVELKYLNLLNQFKSSLNATQMNQCLGGNYPYDGHTIIKTSSEMINLEMLEPEVFIRCYREQLELYKGQQACSF